MCLDRQNDIPVPTPGIDVNGATDVFDLFKIYLHAYSVIRRFI